MRNARALAVGIALTTLGCGSESEGPPAVATVDVSPATATVEVGATTQLSATPRDAGGTALPNPVVWSSAAPTVASVNATGLVTGLAVGAAAITATSSGKQGTANISVIPPAVATVAVTLAATTVELGRTTQASAVLRDVGGNALTGRVITWTSADPAIASVSTTGLVTALAVGTTSITAASEGKTGAASLTVIPRPVNSVVVTLNASSLVAGQTGQATFVARDVDGNTLAGRTGTWSSSNPQVATVHATSGVTTAVAAGQANIIATVEGKTGSAQLTVTAIVSVGTVTGVVTAADGVTPIADALVTVASAALSTRTLLNGTYTLQNVPSGPQVIVASRGAFQATVNVNVQANQTVAAPRAELTSTGKLAYVRGAYDSIESIVQGVLGNQIDEIQATDLASSTVTSKYRMIFLNCGLDQGPLQDPNVATNLKAYLQNGGTIYASDYAAEYVAQLFTGFSFEFAGDVQNTTATVVDASLQAFIGKTSVAIAYDLGAWTDLTAIPSSASVLLRGNYTAQSVQRTNQPLAFVISLGSGRLVFTTFHNEAGATADQIAVLRHFIYLP
jgi:uncharacterized protein YjdB